MIVDEIICRLTDEREEAERKALDSLSRYKFQMFGYWAGIWVHLNRIIGDKHPSPFGELVKSARHLQEHKQEAEEIERKAAMGEREASAQRDLEATTDLRSKLGEVLRSMVDYHREHGGCLLAYVGRAFRDLTPAIDALNEALPDQKRLQGEVVHGRETDAYRASLVSS